MKINFYVLFSLLFGLVLQACSPANPANPEEVPSVIPPEGACLFNAKIINDGETVQAFEVPFVAPGISCETKSEMRLCQDGVLSGMNKFASCEISYSSCKYGNDKTVSHSAGFIIGFFFVDESGTMTRDYTRYNDVPSNLKAKSNLPCFVSSRICLSGVMREVRTTEYTKGFLAENKCENPILFQYRSIEFEVPLEEESDYPKTIDLSGSDMPEPHRFKQ